MKSRINTGFLEKRMWGECKRVHRKCIESVDTFTNNGSEPRVTDRKITKKVLAISESSATISFEHEKSSRSANQKLFSYEYNSCDFGRQTGITSDPSLPNTNQWLLHEPSRTFIVAFMIVVVK